MRFILGFLLAVTTSSSALAGDDWYIAGGAEIGSYRVEDPDQSYTDIALNLRLGYDVGKYFGVEVEGSFHLGGAATSEDTAGSTNYEQAGDVTGRLGGFIRGRVPISDKVGLYARAGLGGRRMTDKSRAFGDVNGTPFDEMTSYSEISLFTALGVGAEFEVGASGRDLIRGDYTVINTFIGYWVEDHTASIAYVRKF